MITSQIPSNQHLWNLLYPFFRVWFNGTLWATIMICLQFNFCFRTAESFIDCVVLLGLWLCLLLPLSCTMKQIWFTSIAMPSTSMGMDRVQNFLHYFILSKLKKTNNQKKKNKRDKTLTQSLLWVKFSSLQRSRTKLNSHLRTPEKA